MDRNHLDSTSIPLSNSQEDPWEFDLLPNEILLQILKPLDIENKLIARTVCKRWSQALQNQLPFSPVPADHNFKYLLNSDVRIELLTLDKMSFKARTPVLTSWSFPSKVQRLRVLDLSHKLSLQILKSCGGLKELELCVGAFRNVKGDEKFISGMSFPNLGTLKINIPAVPLSKSALLSQLLKIKFPFLKECAFNWAEGPGPRHELLAFQNQFIEVLQFIGNHGSTLKSLTIKPPASYIMKELDISAPPIPNEDLRGQLADLKLKKLTLFLMSFQGYGEWNYVDFIVRDQHQLVTLVLNGTFYNSTVAELITKNSSTLTSIQVTVLNSSSPVDCSIFENCRKLQILAIIAHNRKEFLNVINLPTSLVTLEVFGGEALFSTDDLDWISKHLVNLKRFSYLANQHQRQIPMKFTLSIFKSMVLNTSVKEIEIWTGIEPNQILELCASTPGILFEYKLKGHSHLREPWWNYVVQIQRNLFEVPEVKNKFYKSGNSYITLRNVRVVVQP